MPYLYKLRRVEPRSRPARYVAPVAAPEPESETPLDELRKDDLVALAEEAGVDTSGTKADIIARLEGDDDG